MHVKIKNINQYQNVKTTELNTEYSYVIIQTNSEPRINYKTKIWP